MASRKPVIHGRDHLPGGADPIPGLTTGVASSTPFSDLILQTSGLVGYWPLNELVGTTAENAEPVNGSAADGQYINSPTLGDPPLIGDNTAVTFNGTNQLVNVAGLVVAHGGQDNASLFTASGSWTCSCWVKTTQTSAVGIDDPHSFNMPHIIGFADGHFDIFLMRISATGTLDVIAFYAGGTGNWVLLTGATVINDGLRHQVAATYDTIAKTLTLYVDGVADGTTTTPLGGRTSAPEFQIGAYLDGGLFFGFFAGTIDEVALWKAPLTAGDIADQYTTGYVSPTAGTEWLSGVGAPISGIGQDGDFYLNTTNGDVYQKVAGTWVLLGNIGTAAPSGAAGGDLTGTYPNPSLIATGPGATGPIGDGANIPVVSIDAKGRVTALTSAVNTGMPYVGCSVTRNSDQSINNNSVTVINWDAENFDTDGFHDNATNNSRITIPTGKGGKYEVVIMVGNFYISGSSAGRRFITLRKNGSNHQRKEVTCPSSGECWIDLIYIDSFADGDYLEVDCYQSSGTNGASITSDRGASGGVSYFSVTKIA